MNGMVMSHDGRFGNESSLEKQDDREIQGQREGEGERRIFGNLVS